MYKTDRNGTKFMLQDRVNFYNTHASTLVADVGTVVDINHYIVNVRWDSDGELNPIGDPKNFEIVASSGFTDADQKLLDELLAKKAGIDANKIASEKALDEFWDSVNFAYNPVTTIKKNSTRLEYLLREYNKHH